MKLLMYAGAVFFVLVIIILLIMLAKLKISVIIENKIIRIYVFRIKVFDYENSSTEQTEKTGRQKDKEFENKYKGFKQAVNLVRRVFDDKNDDIIYILKHIRRTFCVKRFDISLDYGFGDAAVTGITGGAIWLVISNAAAFVSKYADISKCLNIAVKPHYEEKIINFKVNFVFTARLYHLLQTLRLVLRFRKTLKGGR